MEKLTPEQIEEKRTELEKKHGKKVYAFSFDIEENGIGQSVGYFLEPERLTKSKCLDLCMVGQFNHASEILLTTSIIKEDSDPRILSEDQKYDALYFGYIMKLQEMVKFYTNGVKKN